MKQKKKIIFAALVFAAALLIGWKVKPVELIDNKLLIDLDTAIVEPDWGQEGNPGESAQKPNPEEGDSIFISVRGEEISLNGEKVKDASVLQSYLSVRLKENNAVVLEDNYAEAHVYKEVYNLLVTMQTTARFELKEVTR